jgi:hypothetical protein
MLDMAFLFGGTILNSEYFPKISAYHPVEQGWAPRTSWRSAYAKSPTSANSTHLRNRHPRARTYGVLGLTPDCLADSRLIYGRRASSE